MKRAFLSITVLCSFFVFAVLSCQKDYNNDYGGAPADLNQLFSDLRTAPEHFAVSAGRDTVLLGAKGTKLHIYANSFKDADGNIITSGSVSLDLTEMVSPGDMIQNRATTTMEDDQPLISGGQVNLKVTMAGQEVFANKYGIGFKQNAPSAQPMQLFYGNTKNKDSVVKWTSGSTTAGTTSTGTVRDSVRVGGSGGSGGSVRVDYRYLFDSCSDFNFVNCDHPFTENSLQIYAKITFPNKTFNYDNSQVFVSFPKYKNVTLLRDYTFRNVTVFNGSFFIPDSSDYHLIVISKKADVYYYYQESGITAGDSIKIDAVPEVSTQSIIMTTLATLQ